MPTYQYACTSCGEELEVVQKFTDDALTVCPVCAGRLRKVFSAVGVVFKGSGFYRTDSRAKEPVGAANGTPGSASSGEGAAASSGNGSTKDGGSSSSKDTGGSGTAKKEPATASSSRSNSTSPA
ncbi:MAG TPA: FmdB family zinc ribbon protein [Jiangellaceae bacterium]|nr:FmdB family zinc ribbon protein [Jiangellaceae bacterium]